MASLDQLLAAIAGLDEKDRERLWRRAQQMGLLPEGPPPASSSPQPAIPRSVPAAVLQEKSSPTLQPPLPSPEGHRVLLIFDGGSKGNPGLGYGSYAVRWNDQPEPVRRLTFKGQRTNNEAEYDTLIAALQGLLDELSGSQTLPGNVNLEIRGDSKLVINQLTGAWKAKEPRLRDRRDRARTLLAQFGSASLHHQPRAKSVAVLGH